MILHKAGKNKFFSDMSKDYFDIIKNELMNDINIQLRRREPYWKNFLNWLKDDGFSNLERIIVGEPFVIEAVKELVNWKIARGEFLPISEINKKGKTIWSSFGKKIHKLFNYKSYINRVAVRKFIQEQYDFKVCPYCNRTYISILKGSKMGKFLFHFDHFYPESLYPYLSLSFYNLIPSCSNCNSVLKGQRDFSIFSNLHPYFEDFNKILKFVILTQDGQYLLKDNNYNFKIILQRRNENFPLFVNDEAFTRAEANKRDFKLEEIYNMHKDYVLWIYRQMKIYKENYLKNLERVFPELHFSNANFVNQIFGGYLNDEDLDKRPMSKLTKDILSQSGIID